MEVMHGVKYLKSIMTGKYMASYRAIRITEIDAITEILISFGNKAWELDGVNIKSNLIRVWFFLAQSPN